MANNEENFNDELFEEAAKEAINKQVIEPIEVVQETEEVVDLLPEVIDQAIEHTKINTSGAWKQLKDDLEHKHTKKFNEILGRLPDREFVRVYLKTLEFIKPKLIREKNKEKANENNFININIVTGNSDNEVKIIDITKINENGEK